MKRNFILIAFAVALLGLGTSGCTKEALQQAFSSTSRDTPAQIWKAKRDARRSEAAIMGAYGDTSGVAGIGSKDIIDVLFDFDRYSIRKDAKAVLLSNYDVLKKHDAAKILLEGHCDERGTSEYNIALGERRAKAAKKYLKNLGIDSGRISVISYGKEKPFCSAHNENCWQLNRRVHFKLSN